MTATAAAYLTYARQACAVVGISVVGMEMAQVILLPATYMRGRHCPMQTRVHHDTLTLLHSVPVISLRTKHARCSHQIIVFLLLLHDSMSLQKHRWLLMQMDAAALRSLRI